MTAVTAQPKPTPDPREQPISRYELWAAVAITLLGAAVRFAFPSAMAIEHFDEGVYASNLLFSEQEGGQYPDRHLYAPSLVPALIEWSIILFGDNGIAPMLPSLLFGTLTIPLIWWVGRQWFGPLAGIASATLLSLSDFHIAFSRSALTDVPLCFWLLLAVYLFERCFRDLSWPTAIAAGLTTGLAWWTKYNGWLPLAISLSGLIAWSLFARRDERHFLRRLSLWTIAAATALVIWSPYLLTLPHGYREVTANHRNYVGGFEGWIDRAMQQAEALDAFDGRFLALMLIFLWLSFCSTPRSHIAWWVEKRIESGTVVDRSELPACGQGFVATFSVSVSIGLFLAAMLAFPFGINVILVTIAALQILVGGYRTIRYHRALTDSRSEFTVELACRLRSSFFPPFSQADWLVAAWAFGLTLSIPMYRAYPRLILPWSIAIILLATRPGEFVRASRLMSQTGMLFPRIIVFVIGVVCFGSILSNGAIHSPALRPRTALRDLSARLRENVVVGASQFQRTVGTDIRAVLYVYAEPGLFFHLPTDGLAVQPAGNLNFVDIEATRKLPTFLVTGPHAHRSRAFADEFAKRADQFELIASYPYDASDFVRLDDVSATQLRAHRESLEVRLYRVRVPERPR